MALFLMNAVGAGATSLQQHRRSGSGGGGGGSDTVDDDRLLAQSQRQRNFHCTRVNVARLLACCEQHLAAAAASSGDPLEHDDSVVRRHAMISKVRLNRNVSLTEFRVVHFHAALHVCDP
jgi:hypothetical protein